MRPGVTLFAGIALAYFVPAWVSWELEPFYWDRADRMASVVIAVITLAVYGIQKFLTLGGNHGDSTRNT